MPSPSGLNQTLAQATRHIESQQWDKAERILRRALKAAPDDVGILSRLAAVQARLGNYRRAMDSINAAIKRDPDNIESLTTRVDILARQARIGDAIESTNGIIQRFPDNAGLLAMRSGLLLHAGESNAAWDDMNRAIQLDPDNLDLLGRFVDTTIARGIVPMDHGPADRLVKAQPFEARNHARLGTVLRINDDLPGAEAAYREALRLDPRNTDSLAGLADVMESAGQSSEALDVLRPTIESDRSPLNPMLSWTRILSRLGRHDELVRDARRWIERSGLTTGQLAPLLFRIGNALDALGRHDEAFEAWTAGNTPFHDRWNDRVHAERTDAIIAEFTSPQPHGPSSDATTPIFIVGMFRSGTTLLEQVLAAHPAVHAVGESPALPAIIRSLSGTYPGNIRELDPAALRKLGQTYLERISVDAADASHVTDKLPMNYMNVGLIDRMLPQARILHCRRDALDVCLSCYSNQMTSTLAFTSNLESMGRTYVQYRRLMDHWSNAGYEVLDVVYEDLVGNPEAQSRRIVEWTGLDWDPACLDYHRSKRIAQTPSMDQVRQPMHTRSIHRSRAYWDHLAPLRAALGDLTPDRAP
tara:strand:- start:9125 stop:10882 length:1758 start_codon:yes stop_codon:yes gene_type:complete